MSAKPSRRWFTVWICDKAKYSDEPFICQVRARNGEEIESESLKVYRMAHNMPEEGWRKFANMNNAYVFQVIAGQVAFERMTVNHDGLSDEELNAAYATAKQKEIKSK